MALLLVTGLSVTSFADLRIVTESGDERFEVLVKDGRILSRGDMSAWVILDCPTEEVTYVYFDYYWRGPITEFTAALDAEITKLLQGDEDGSEVTAFVGGLFGMPTSGSSQVRLTPLGDRLEIYLFAPFRVTVDGTIVSADRWRGRVPRSLLKVLALSHHGCTSDQLLDLFWPDYPPAQARQRLYEAMSRLRRALTVDGVERSPGSTSTWPVETFDAGYRLAESTWVDVRAFHHRVSMIRQLRATDPKAAIRLLGDEQLPNPDALLVDEPYADWALTARERVYDDVRLLEEMKVELLLEHGRPLDALDTLQALFKMDPTSEDTGRRAMEIAWRLGLRKTAIAIFHRMQKALLEDLGVEPSEETLALYRRMGDVRPRLKTLGGPPRPPQLVATPAGQSAGDAYTAGFGGHVESAPRNDTRNDMNPNFFDAPEDSMFGQPPAYLTRFVGRESELPTVADATLRRIHRGLSRDESRISAHPFPHRTHQSHRVSGQIKAYSIQELEKPCRMPYRPVADEAVDTLAPHHG